MEHLEKIRKAAENIKAEHLNADKVYFANEVLTDNNVLPIYSKLCMVLDIYGVRHEIAKETEIQCCKAYKPTWLAESGIMADHIESIVRYIGNNRVLMTNCAEYDTKFAATLKETFESDGYEVVELSFSTCEGKRNRKDMSWAYINYIQTSKVVIVPMQRIEEDKEALEQIKTCFPDLAVVGVYAQPFFSDEGEFVCYSKSIQDKSMS